MLLLRPFGPYTLMMPRPITALSLGVPMANGYVDLVTGDAEGGLYAPRKDVPHPIGSVPGRVTALRCGRNGSFVVAYAPSEGEQRVEIWNAQGDGAKRKAEIGRLPAEARPILAGGAGGIVFGHVGGRSVSRIDEVGNPLGRLENFPEGLVGVAPTASGKTIAAFANGTLVIYGQDGAVRGRRTLRTVGRVSDFEGNMNDERAAWLSDEAGGRVGIVDLRSGDAFGASFASSDVVAAKALWSGMPLLIGKRTVEVRRHVAPWSFAADVVAADNGSSQVAVALADGTLIVRNPLTKWFRKGELLPPE